MKLNKTCSPLQGAAVTQWNNRRVQSPAQEVSIWGRPAVRAEARMSLSGWAYLNQTLEDEHFLPVVFPHPSAEMPSRGIHASYIPWNSSRVRHHPPSWRSFWPSPVVFDFSCLLILMALWLDSSPFFVPVCTLASFPQLNYMLIPVSPHSSTMCVPDNKRHVKLSSK